MGSAIPLQEDRDSPSTRGHPRIDLAAGCSGLLVREAGLR